MSRSAAAQPIAALTVKQQVLRSEINKYTVNYHQAMLNNAGIITLKQFILNSYNPAASFAEKFLWLNVARANNITDLEIFGKIDPQGSQNIYITQYLQGTLDISNASSLIQLQNALGVNQTVRDMHLLLHGSNPYKNAVLDAKLQSNSELSIMQKAYIKHMYGLEHTNIRTSVTGVDGTPVIPPAPPNPTNNNFYQSWAQINAQQGISFEQKYGYVLAISDLDVRKNALDSFWTAYRSSLTEGALNILKDGVANFYATIVNLPASTIRGYAFFDNLTSTNPIELRGALSQLLQETYPNDELYIAALFLIYSPPVTYDASHTLKQNLMTYAQYFDSYMTDTTTLASLINRSLDSSTLLALENNAPENERGATIRSRLENDRDGFVNELGAKFVSVSGHALPQTDLLTHGTDANTALNAFWGQVSANFRIFKITTHFTGDEYYNSIHTVSPVKNILIAKNYTITDGKITLPTDSANIMSISNEYFTSAQIILTGTWSNDYMVGGNRNDTLHGVGGDDYIIGNDGDDTLNGGSGNDRLYGNDGVDTLNGGDYTDHLFGGNGRDIMNGGSGIDYLYGGTGNDTMNGGYGPDYLYGDTGNDTMNGDSDTDHLYGGTGNDTMNGGSGTDYLYGGTGNDTLKGGAGRDYLFGGPGNDIFVVQQRMGTVMDKIMDFNYRQDKIRLERPDPTLLNPEARVALSQMNYLFDTGVIQGGLTNSQYNALGKIYGRILDTENFNLNDNFNSFYLNNIIYDFTSPDV